MSTEYPIGYQALLELFKTAQKETPRGVSLKRKEQRIYLQFKTPSEPRKPYTCNCHFSIDGISRALEKAKLVADKLATLESEVEFWEWYDQAIKELGVMQNDIKTFGEVIKQIEDEYFDGYRLFKKPREKRDRNDLNDRQNWQDTHGKYYQHLPQDKEVNFGDIQTVLARWGKGSKYLSTKCEQCIRPL